jgi:hypothetical protein
VTTSDTIIESSARQDGRALCGANRRQEPGSCGHTAGWGTSHLGIGRCKLHGGSTPSQVQKAVEDQAAAAMLTYGRPVDTNPIDALLSELRWTFGHVIWLRDRVQALNPEVLVWGLTKRTAEASVGLEISEVLGIDAVPTVEVQKTEAAGVTVWVKLYLEERKHLVEVAATCARLNIDERKVRLAEQQGQLLVAGLQWFIARLELSAAKAELANQLAPEMFRLLDTGVVPAIEGPR